MFMGPGKSYIQQEPLGVIGIMGSWNFPIATSLGPLVSAMAAGNAVVLKPSEMAPYSAKIMKTLFARHLDLNAYQCVNGQVQVAIRTSQSPFDKIVFTGSTEKGKLVAAAAARNLTPCILELGGKCPIIVDKSADMDYAVSKIATISFINSGQLCIRADYCLIESSLVNTFVKKLHEKLEHMYKLGE